MTGISPSTIIQLILGCTGIAILTAIGFYLSSVLRAHSLQREPKTEEHLDYFRELSSQGELTEREFRIIKKQLSSQIADAAKAEREKTSTPVFRPELPDVVPLMMGQVRQDGQNDDTGSYSAGDTAMIDNSDKPSV